MSGLTHLLARSFACDAILRHCYQTTADVADVLVRFNSDSGTNYPEEVRYLNGSTLASFASTYTNVYIAPGFIF